MHASDRTEPWRTDAWIAQTQLLLDSYHRLLGHDLIDRAGSPAEQAGRLFEAPRVVVSHGTETDPILNYANAAALALWETDVATLLAMPSRLTAEPVAREERERLLQRTRVQGYVDDYRGVRISARGRRFLVERATVWNLTSAAGEYLGQAATFTQWQHL